MSPTLRFRQRGPGHFVRSSKWRFIITEVHYGGALKWMLFLFFWNPIKIDDFGVPPILGNPHTMINVYYICLWSMGLWVSWLPVCKLSNNQRGRDIFLGGQVLEVPVSHHLYSSKLIRTPCWWGVRTTLGHGRFAGFTTWPQFSYHIKLIISGSSLARYFSTLIAINDIMY